MHAIALLPLLLIVLLVLGSLAAVVFFAVHTLANKGSGTFTRVLGFVGAAMLVGLAAVGVWQLFAQPKMMSARIDHSSGPAVYLDGGALTTSPTEWHSNGVSPAVEFHDPNPPSVNWDLSWGGILLIALLLGVLIAVARRGGQPDGRSHRGWAMVGILALVLFFIVPLLSYQSQHNWVAEQTASEQARIAQEINRKVNRDPQAQTVVDAVAQKHGGLTHGSMQEIWEQLHEPKITLSGNSQEASVDVPDPITESERTESESPELTEGLANKAERIARLARLLAVVADQVSDVASAVGRGFVATDGTTDSRPGSSKETDDAVELAEHVESTVESTAGPPPAWIDDAPKRFGKNWREVIMVGDYATTEECDEAANRKLLQVTYRHLRDLTGAPDVQEAIDYSRSDIFATRPPKTHEYAARLGRMGVGVDYIRRNIVKDRYFEMVQRSVGDMHRLYMQLEFTPTVDRELKSRWDACLRQERFAMVGIGAGSVLGLVGVVFGLLKADTWTRGYYTKRLFLGVPAAIIGIIALLALIVG